MIEIEGFAKRIPDPENLRAFSWYPETFGLVARNGYTEKEDDQDPWFWVAPFCRCMVRPGLEDELNKYGEVNWTKSEMIPLSDEEALRLMDEHVCRR